MPMCGLDVTTDCGAVAKRVQCSPCPRVILVHDHGSGAETVLLPEPAPVSIARIASAVCSFCLGGHPSHRIHCRGTARERITSIRESCADQRPVPQAIASTMLAKMPRTRRWPVEAAIRTGHPSFCRRFHPSFCDPGLRLIQHI